MWIVLGIVAALVLGFQGHEAYATIKEDNSVDENWTIFDSLFKKFGQAYGVNPNYLKAICMNESSLGTDESVVIGIKTPLDIENSKSSDGKSWGIMQVTVTTGSDYDENCSPELLNNPSYSVDLAAQIFRDNMKRFSSSEPRYLELVVKSYNEGAGNAKKELAGTGGGYADEYWNRWQRNYQKIVTKGLL